MTGALQASVEATVPSRRRTSRQASAGTRERGKRARPSATRSRQKAIERGKRSSPSRKRTTRSPDTLSLVERRKECTPSRDRSTPSHWTSSKSWPAPVPVVGGLGQLHQAGRPHVEHPGGHVGPLQLGADAEEVVGVVTAHAVGHHAGHALAVGDDPLEELVAPAAAAAAAGLLLDHVGQFVDQPPRGAGNTWRVTRRFSRARRRSTSEDGVARVGEEELHHRPLVGPLVVLAEAAVGAGDGQQGLPGELDPGGRSMSRAVCSITSRARLSARSR